MEPSNRMEWISVPCGMWPHSPIARPPRGSGFLTIATSKYDGPAIGSGFCAEMICQPGWVDSMVFFFRSRDVVCTGLTLFSCRKGDSFQASASNSMLCRCSAGMTGVGASIRSRRFWRNSMTSAKHAGLKSRKNLPISSRGTSPMNSSLKTRLKTLPSMLQRALRDIVKIVPEQLMSMISVSVGHSSFILSLSLSSRFHSASIFVRSAWHHSSVSCRSLSSSAVLPSRSCWICCHVPRILSRSASMAASILLKEGSMRASFSMARRVPSLVAIQLQPTAPT
mmetsp:Transcript_24988/g.71946  ORF Transcript_24988/g.71946 Transcript_24988/m.71946 type:complete len:281 (-) Transcript_24988:67-909(-)